MPPRILAAVVVAAWLAGASPVDRVRAQEPVSPVDFARDVQPILRQSCYGCHGPTQRMGGLRLDRRADAMRGGTIAVIGPGNSAGSRLYLKLVGSEFGAQMPPTGALKPEQVRIIKAWIDQGADWPDAVSGETPLPPADPAARRMMKAIRNGDGKAVAAAMPETAKAPNARGDGGATALMYAALYGDLALERELLDRGADPNARNHVGATALMWAVGDLDRTRLLLDHGADVNARSDEGRTPLMIAAGRTDSADVVRLLLDRGANIAAKATSFLGETNALAEAAYAGDERTMRLLIDRGADPKSAIAAMPLAVAAQCPSCLEMLLGFADQGALDSTMLLVAPPFFDTTSMVRLLARGADAKARDPEGRSLLMLAAVSDTVPVETIKELLARGADVNLTSMKGQTALQLAALHGQTPVVDLLVKAGARPDASPRPAPEPNRTAPFPLRAAVERSLPLVQKNAIAFREKTGCVSCHNNALTAVTVAAARAKGLRVSEADSKAEVERTAAYLSSWRERVLQGIGIPGDSDSIAYILFGLAAERFPANEDTDAMARFMLRYQSADGRWRIVAHRPPIESSDLAVTAIAARTLQTYAPAAERPVYERAIGRAAAWMTQARPRTPEDRVFQLLGLTWTSAPPPVLRRLATTLMGEQRADGGWSQLPTLSSDAYATGEALFALRESGMVKTTDATYSRGVRFLLTSQAADGSWHVPSRALPIQPYFESGFPYGRDQFISAAATGWATTALAAAVK